MDNNTEWNSDIEEYDYEEETPLFSPSEMKKWKICFNDSDNNIYSYSNLTEDEAINKELDMYFIPDTDNKPWM